jgi:Na+/serine symporter
VGVENTHVTLELLIPALLAVLVQWGLVRRRWLRAAGDEDLTRWPWVTTVVAGLVILNPIGLAVVATTLERSGSEFMWQYFAMVTAAVGGLLVVMAAIECYIRARMLRRRPAASLPPMGGEAGTPG